MTKPSNIEASNAMIAEVKSKNPQLDKVTHYLEQGADISFQDEEGNTPIIIAVGNHNYKLVELLLSHGADINIRNNLRQTVFNVVKDDDIWHLLRRERELPRPDDFKTPEHIENDRELAVIKRTKKEREGKPFDVSLLKIDSFGKYFAPPPTKAQFDDLESHYGHSIPPYLKEIFTRYNGGRPSVNFFTENVHDYSIYTISFFFKVNDDIDNCTNIWNVINNYSSYLGPETLPFAEASSGRMYYLKWVHGKSQVWTFSYGGDMVFDEDEDESDIDDPDALPFSRDWVSDSLEEFLECSYEDR